MAIFKSTLLSDIRGSLNGSTFSRTKAGNIIRNRTQPVQPNTAFQVQQRAFMQTATDLFRALPSSEVADWQDAIATSGFTMQNALGDTYTPSAKQVFTMAALNLTKEAGLAQAPELSKFIADNNLPGLTYSAPTISVDIGPPTELATLTIEDVASTVPAALQVAATLPLSPSIRNYKKYLRVLTGGGSLSVNTTPASKNILPVYIPRYGQTIFENDDMEGLVINFAIRALNLDTGLAGAWLYIGGIDVPAGA